MFFREGNSPAGKRFSALNGAELSQTSTKKEFVIAVYREFNELTGDIQSSMILSQMYYHKRPCNLAKLHDLILLKQKNTKPVLKRLQQLIDLGLVNCDEKANHNKIYTLNSDKLPQLSNPIGYIFASDFANGNKPRYIELLLINRIKYYAFNNKGFIYLSRKKLCEEYKVYIPETTMLNAIRYFINIGFITRVDKARFTINIEVVKNTFINQATHFEYQKVSANFLIVDYEPVEVSETLYREATKQDKKIPVYNEYVNDCGSYELAVLYNQIKFSYKEELTLEEIEELICIDWHKNTTRNYLKRLSELGYLSQRNDTVNGECLYRIREDLSSDNMTILAILDEKDIKAYPHYLTAGILNFFRELAISNEDEISISAKELYERLGGEKSSSTVRNILIKLTKNNYISSQLVGRKYRYTIHQQKITNILNANRFNKQVKELTTLYGRYCKRASIEADNRKITKIFKRMLIDKATFSTLQHILAYLLKTMVKHKVTIDELQTDYQKLRIDAYSLLKVRTGQNLLKRLSYKKQDFVISDKKILTDKELWLKVEELTNKSKKALSKWYYNQSKGTSDIDIEDYIQEAKIIIFDELRKDINRADSYIMNSAKYKLMEFMRAHKLRDDKNDVVFTIEDDISELYAIGEEDKSLNSFILGENNSANNETDFSSAGIKEFIKLLLSSLDEGTANMIIDYYGLNGAEPLSYRELGVKYNKHYTGILRVMQRALRRLKGMHEPPPELEI